MRRLALSVALTLAACSQSKPSKPVQTTQAPPASPPAATPAPRQETVASKADTDILHSAAMYVEFEKQAAGLAKPALAKFRSPNSGIGVSGGQGGSVYRPGPPPPGYRQGMTDQAAVTTLDRDLHLIDSVLASREAEVQAIADAAKLLNLPPPDGALDDDHKAYLGIIKGSDGVVSSTLFAAEQATIHLAMISDVQGFLTDNPKSRIRHWAEGFLATLKSRLKDVQAPN
jgi:hypothetical protein